MKPAARTRKSVTPAVRARVREQLRAAPFVSGVLRARVVSLHPGEIVLAMVPRRGLTQYQGILQGGVLAGFADAAATFAVNSLLHAEEDSITIELKMNYLAPAAPGRITAAGRVLHRGRRTAVAAVEVHDSRGRLSCFGTFTSMILVRTS